MRDVIESDLPIFFEHQQDPEATSMAAFPARDREAFDAHWQKILADDTLTTKTVIFEDRVAGNVGSWPQDGKRLVGYWIGREFWGQGLATRALAVVGIPGQSPTARCTRTWPRPIRARSESWRSADSSWPKRSLTKSPRRVQLQAPAS